MASRYAAGAGRRSLASPRLRLPSRRRVVAGALIAAALVAGYMLWLRHSSLVAVDEVEVSGVSYAEEEVTAALTAAGKDMTTLAADPQELERAVAGYPTVAAISVSTDFPRRLEVTVTERVPVATVGGGEGVAVAGDGTVLSGVDAGESKLPPIEAKEAPSSGRLEGNALAQAGVLGAAPEPLRAMIRAAEVTGDYGIVVELRGGIELRFGDDRDAAVKWSAAAAILADPKLESLSYIDLRLPGRPAVGGAPPVEPDDDEALGSPPTGLPDEPAEVQPSPVDPAGTPAPAEPAAPAPSEPATLPDPASAPPPAGEAAVAQQPATGVAGGAAAP